MLAYGNAWRPPVSMEMGFDLPTGSNFDPPGGVDALQHPHAAQHPPPPPPPPKQLTAADRRENRRNFHRKVRTGCATCKARHVKCDEAKPECKRCTSTGRTCEGYQQAKKERANNQAILLPQPRNASEEGEAASDSASRTPSTSSSRSRSRSNTPPETGRTTAPMSGALGFFISSDPKEKRFLEMFLSDTLPKIWHIELPQPKAWQRLMTQLVWDEPVVRHSAIALAAAHERQRLIRNKQRKDPSRYAIEYYNRAIGHLLNDQPDTAAQATRSAIVLLTSCLLFVTMEMFLGRDGEVRTHLRSGVRILRQTRFADFATEEARLLAANFEALDVHALMYPGAGRSYYDNGFEPDPTALDSFSLAPAFDDFPHAVRTYHSLCAEIQRYQHQVQAAADPGAMPFLLSQAHLTECLEGWQAAYATLQADPAQQSATGSLTGQILAIAVATQLLCVRGSTDPTHLGWDAMEGEVQALLPRLDAAIGTRDPAASRFSLETLSNEIMVIWYLYRLCRSPAVRDALSGLLWKAFGRRGAWCAMATFLSLQRVRALEEAGAMLPAGEKVSSAAQIPSESRLAYVAMENNGNKHFCRLLYRRVGDPVGTENEVNVELWH